jgi:tetratricopeptide (TPR) repeat protein
MKKSLIFILISCYIVSYSQELILPNNLQQYYKLVEEINGPSSSFRTLETDSTELSKKLEKYDSLFKIKDIDFSRDYSDYAYVLAKLGNYEKALEYYELCFKLNSINAKEFEKRKDHFEKDTVLFNQKKEEFYKKYPPQFYNEKELEHRLAVREIFGADQLARYYHDDYPQYKNCSNNIIEYVDSITMVKIVKLLEKYPEYTNPLSVNAFDSWIIGRHIFTAYPEFWLTYFEPREREALLKGNGLSPTEYARTYDRAVVVTEREQYSYYGEWDDNGKAANPDKELVNKRRANLGLLPLGEKKDDSKIFFITY